MTLPRVNQCVVAPLQRAWAQIWFQDRSTTPLEIARIGVGAALLLHYAIASPHLLLFWGDAGWLPRPLLGDLVASPWIQSAFFYFTAPWQ